jgi:hypothetical protein
MAAPNGGLINETNQQYYAGSQIIMAAGTELSLVYTFDEPLKLYSGTSWSPLDSDHYQNNFIFEYSPSGLAPYPEYTIDFKIANNTITRADGLAFAAGFYRVRLRETNYGSYIGISLNEIINNFTVAYVGDGKLIPSVKRTDVLFHAKRGMQEFSYDTLRSVKQQELSVPNNLSIILPQDYVNYVKISRVDALGVKHIIYPTRLTSNPTEMPIQEIDTGAPIQDQYANNLQGTPIIEENWANADDKRITGTYDPNFQNAQINANTWNGATVGQRYGLNPETSNMNGWFTINNREGKISFSSNLVGSLIIFEYISDGLAYDADTVVPKMAEEALYAHIAYSILAGRVNVPEYIVQRYKRDRSAKLRNTKIRLSNIKLEEITQVMRNKSKWIKH